MVDCTHGEGRLVGGNNPTEGLLEVCYEGVWGTVCSDRWSRQEVAVACRQLGFSSSGKSKCREWVGMKMTRKYDISILGVEWLISYTIYLNLC